MDETYAHIISHHRLTTNCAVCLAYLKTRVGHRIESFDSSKYRNVELRYIVQYRIESLDTHVEISKYRTLTYRIISNAVCPPSPSPRGYPLIFYFEVFCTATGYVH